MKCEKCGKEDVYYSCISGVAVCDCIEIINKHQSILDSQKNGQFLCCWFLK